MTILKEETRRTIQPENFGDRIIFMCMFDDIIWNEETMKESVFQIPNRSEIT